MTTTGQDDSSLCVQLTLQDGQLLVDPGLTTFAASSGFQTGLKISADDAKRQLILDLNTLFKKLPRLYYFGLTDDERIQDSKGTLKSSTTDALRHFSKSWAEFRKAEPTWHKENTDRLIDGELLGQFVNSAQSQGLIWGAAFYDDSIGPPPPINVKAGTIQLRVADPIDWDDSKHFAIQVDGKTGDGLDDSKIRDLLRPLQGHLWRDPDMREFVSEAAARRGININIEIVDAGQTPKLVHVTREPRIARVVFSPPVSDSDLTKTADLDRTLYILLESELYAKYLADRKKYVRTIGTVQQLDYLGLVPTEPLFNTLTFGGQQAEWKQLGFTAGVSTSGGRTPRDGSFVDIILQKDTNTNAAQPKQPAAKSSATAEKPGAAGPKRVAPTPAPAVAAKTDAAAPGAAANPTPPPADPGSPQVQLPPPRDKQNYIGAGFEYKPGQGVKPIVDYEYVRLLGPGSVSLETGSDNQNPLGSGSLNFDYIAFSKLHHRVAFSASAASILTVNRLLGTTALDERRTGVTARLEGEAFRNFHGGQLLFYTEARRVSVDLSNPQGSAGKLNLSMLDFGSSLSWASPGAATPWSLRIQPRVRHGLGLAASEPEFTSFDSTGNFHWVSLGPFELDLSAHFAWANRNTPLVELPSFGGVDSVRGFRSDDLLTTQYWAVQPEVWATIPGTQLSVSGVGAFLRRNVRLALFADTGHATHPIAGPGGYKAGPGAGIRFLQGPVVLQLDWAKAVGGAVTDSRWGRVYFNIRFN